MKRIILSAVFTVIVTVGLLFLLLNTVENPQLLEYIVVIVMGLGMGLLLNKFLAVYGKKATGDSSQTTESVKNENDQPA